MTSNSGSTYGTKCREPDPDSLEADLFTMHADSEMPEFDVDRVFRHNGDTDSDEQEEDEPIDKVEAKMNREARYPNWSNVRKWTWLFMGMTGTGKSYAIRHLMYMYRDLVPYGFIFSHTKMNGFYQQFFPNHKIIDHFDNDFLRKILAVQRERVRMKGINSLCLVVLDDIVSEKNLRYMDAVIEFAMEARHYNIICCITTQHYTRVPTEIRTNARWQVFFTMDHLPSLKHAWEECAGDYPNAACLRVNWDKYTKDHRCVVVHRDPNARGAEKYFTWKAKNFDDGPAFAFGCNDMWGGPKNEMAARQRKLIPPHWDYRMTTLKRMFHPRLTQPKRNVDDSQTIDEKQLQGRVESNDIYRDERMFTFGDELGPPEDAGDRVAFNGDPPPQNAFDLLQQVMR